MFTELNTFRRMVACLQVCVAAAIHSRMVYLSILPVSSVSAILLQIRLAISNLDPRPARLASNWDQ